MYLTKEEILKSVVDSIGPGLCRLKELFEKLPGSVRGCFKNYDEFCQFINKRWLLFDLVNVNGSICVRLKAPTPNVQSSPSKSSEPVKRGTVTKVQLENSVMEAIGSDSCQIKEVFAAIPDDTRRKCAILDVKTLRRYLEKRPHLADVVQKGRKTWVKRKSNFEVDQNRKRQIEIFVLESMPTEFCHFNQVFDKLPPATKGLFESAQQFRSYLLNRPHLFEFSEEKVKRASLLQEAHKMKTQSDELKRYMRSDLVAEHMMIIRVAYGRMALFHKIRSLQEKTNVDISNFTHDKEYYIHTVYGGINFRSVVENLKIEEILMEFIAFLSSSPGEWCKIQDFNQRLTSEERRQFGLTSVSHTSMIERDNFIVLLVIFKLFPQLFEISGTQPRQARLIENEAAFFKTLKIAAQVHNNSTWAIFHTLPPYCKRQFSNYDDFHRYFTITNGNLKKEFTWNQTKHSSTELKPRLTLKSIQDELQSLAQEDIDEHSNDDVEDFINKIAALSKKAEVFRKQKNEEFLCEELAPVDDCTADDSVIEI